MNLGKKTNILKLAGIKHFFILEFYSDYIKVSLFELNDFFLIFKNKVKFKLVLNRVLIKNENELEITKDICSLITEIGIKEFLIIIGVTEFKFRKLTLSNEVENIEEWFSDNKLKFIPEGRPENEFEVFYKEYYKDDNLSYVYTFLLRNNYLQNILNLGEFNKYILSIYPIPFFVFDRRDLSDYIFIGIEKDKIAMAAKNSAGDIFYDEYFLDNKTSNNIYDTIEDALISLKQGMLISSFTMGMPSIHLSYQNLDKLNLYKIIDNVFDKYSTIKNIDDNSYFMASQLVFEHYIHSYNNKLQFLEVDKKIKINDLLEKKALLRITLYSSLLICFYLVLLIISENHINNKLEEFQDVSDNMLIISNENKNLEKENNLMLSNIKLFNSLKEKYFQYSNVLEDISLIINNNCYLTEMNIVEDKKNIFSVEISGYSKDQLNVGNFISSMEESNKFNNIKLLFSSIDKNKFELEDNIKFKFKCIYDAK
ncbi:MAG TPA: PilN domain-containing protein [Ignavibacteriaceae bacterium]|nr:PilN domain-containing protein [Ignavibacteriaceae bacterium]